MITLGENYIKQSVKIFCLFSVLTNVCVQKLNCIFQNIDCNFLLQLYPLFQAAN